MWGQQAGLYEQWLRGQHLGTCLTAVDSSFTDACQPWGCWQSFFTLFSTTLLFYSVTIPCSSCWIFQHLKSPTNEVHFSSKSGVWENHLCVQLPFHFCTFQLLFYTPAFSAIITLNILNSLFSPSSYSSLSLISLGKPACCLTSHPLLNS